MDRMKGNVNDETKGKWKDLHVFTDRRWLSNKMASSDFQ